GQGAGPTCLQDLEERQRKLQEYLAAKGKLKEQNTKPYLKAKNNCLKPPPSKPTAGPQRHVTQDAVLPGKATRPITTKLQPRSANIRESQKPKLEPPNLQGKRLTSKCPASNPNWELSSKSHQQHKAGPSAARELSRKPTRSPDTQEQQGVESTDCGLQVEEGFSPEPFSEQDSSQNSSWTHSHSWERSPKGDPN
uniref:Cytoskeleton associated protein 2 like n=1 Tax=Spermophilus dauricus TaxID=99837 RepID=A0A8C9Q2M3_SPEDA